MEIRFAMGCYAEVRFDKGNGGSWNCIGGLASFVGGWLVYDNRQNLKMWVLGKETRLNAAVDYEMTDFAHSGVGYLMKVPVVISEEDRIYEWVKEERAALAWLQTAPQRSLQDFCSGLMTDVQHDMWLTVGPVGRAFGRIAFLPVGQYMRDLNDSAIMFSG